MKILFDTNILIYIAKYKIDIEQLRGNELFVLSSVLHELEKISSGRGKRAESARTALHIANNFKIINAANLSTDSILLEFGKKGYLIATQDFGLQKRLKAAGARYIYLRQKKYFEGL